MSQYQAFEVELDGNIAHVRINRPEKGQRDECGVLD